MRILKVTGKGQIKVKPDVTRIVMTLTGIIVYGALCLVLWKIRKAKDPAYRILP